VSRLARIGLLAALGLATLLLAGRTAAFGPAPLTQVLPFAAMFCIAFVLALFHLRSIAFAALAALAPLVAVPWLDMLAMLWPQPAVPDSAGLAFGFAVAVMLAGMAARNFVMGRAPGSEAAAAVRQLLPAWAASLAGLAILLAGSAAAGLAQAWDAAWFMIAAVAGSCLAALLLVLTMPIVPVSEDFIARWNRADEFRGRLFSLVAAVAGPRWGWSAGGISLVLAAIAFFAARGNVPVAPWAAYGAVVLGSALVVLRSWRGAVAAAIALFAVPLTAQVTGSSGAAWICLSIVPLFCTLTFAGKLTRIQETEPLEAAIAAAYGEVAGAVVLAGLAAAAALAVNGIFRGHGALDAVAVCAGVAAALIVQPAFAAIFVSLLPRRRSVEELYRAT